MTDPLEARDVSEIEPIPHEVLEAARLKLSRRLAAAIVTGMAETGSSAEYIAMRLGKRKGYVWRILKRLLDGRHKSLGDIGAIFAAMALEIEFRIVPREVPSPNGE